MNEIPAQSGAWRFSVSIAGEEPERMIPDRLKKVTTMLGYDSILGGMMDIESR